MRAVNGREVDSIADVEEALREADGGFHTVSFFPNAVRAELVLDAGSFREASARILEACHVPEEIRRERAAAAPRFGEAEAPAE